MDNASDPIIVALRELTHDEELSPSAAFCTNARIRILNTIQSGATPSTYNRRLPGLTYLFRFAAPIIILLFAGVVYAAQSSNPRDMLFPVKLLSERAALTLSPSESAKTSVASEIIGRRAQEGEHAKNEGDIEELQQSAANFDTSVSRIRETKHIDQEKIENEIQKYEEIFRDEEKETKNENLRSPSAVKGSSSETDSESHREDASKKSR